MSLFAGLKEKLADKLAEFKASAAPQDPLDRQVSDLVDKATSDELIAADWTLNFAVVDFVNSDVRLNSGRTLKAIRRSLTKQNTKVQLLSLTLLETCVKNCAAEFHLHLGTSELFADIAKLAGDSSISRVDNEVRDKMLILVEDFARALQPSQFQAAYEHLLDTGVDFPVRGAEDAVPILTQPAHHASAAASGPPGPAPPTAAPAIAALATAAPGNAAAAASGGDAGAGGGGGDASDPLAGVDEQDRAAIAAALQELEAEAQAAQAAERIAAEADAEERRQMQEQQRRAAEAAEAEAEAQAAAALVAADELSRAAAMAAGTGHPGSTGPSHGALGASGGGDGDVPVQQHQQQQPLPQPEPQQTAEERTAGLLETASNCTLLLSEMLAGIPDTEPLAVREPYVAELADTCVRLRSRLERELSRLEDEALLSSALSQHEELARVLGRYEDLLAAAESLAPTLPRNAAAVAASHAALGLQGQGQGQGHHLQQQQQPQPPLQAAQQEVPAGQKVTQTAAAVAAALKEKFTGAFDRLVAAAASARAPAATGAAAGSGAGGSSASDAFGGINVGGPLPPVQEGGEGTFTLLDDEEDEANEGTSLITKRAPAAAGALPLSQYQPPSYYAAPAEQPQAQPWAPAPLAAQQQQPWAPAAPAAAAPDLICLDDEPSEVAQQPGALSSGAQGSGVPAQQVADATADLLAGLAVQDNAGPADLASATHSAPLDEPHGAPPHQPHPQAAQAPEPAQSQQQADHAPLPAAPAPVAVVNRMTHGSVSRDGSHGDQLVAALDALVDQESVASTPQAAAAAEQQNERHQQQQQQQ